MKIPSQDHIVLLSYRGGSLRRRMLGFGLIVGMAITVPLMASDTFFVDPDGSHTAPYDTWGKAATNIQAAIDVAAGGDTVLVGAGEYAIHEQINVVTGLNLIADQGPDVTVITRASGSIRIINIAHADAFVSGFTVTNGYRPSGAQGSGIYMTGGTVSNCVIVGNSHDRGSAIRMTGGLLTHCEIRSNLDTGNSGGCGGARISGDAVIEWSTFYDNRPGTENNGVMALWISDQATVRNSVIQAHRANGTRVHRAVLINGPGALLQNCLIFDNPGHGVHMTANAVVENCTITRNIVFGDTGNGVWMSAGTVRNSIVFGNGASIFQTHANDIHHGGGTIAYTASGVLMDGTGNIDLSPRFRNPDQDDFRLLSGSPAINAADPESELIIDLEGLSRPADGLGNGVARVDMGAHETLAADSGALRCGFTASVYEAVGSTTITLTPFVAGADTNITFVGWDFGDGTTTNSGDPVPVTHTFEPGTYDVSLTVSNTSMQMATVTKTHDIRITVPVIFVSPNGLHEFPYDTWERATTNIQAGIDAVLITNGIQPLVTVTDGVYEISTQINVFKPLKIESVNGPELTEITRASGSARIFNLAHPDAFAGGFTFRGGNLGHGSGLLMSGGTISNCVIVGNTHNRASAVRMTSGLMTHCEIRSNLETGNSGGCGGARISGNAVIEWSTFYDNRPGTEGNGVMALWISDQAIVRNSVIYEQRENGVRTHRTVLMEGAGALLQNCLIVDNPGHGVYMTANATIENCTITRNSVLGDIGNGIWMSAGTVRNSIIWNNGTDNAQNVEKSGGQIIYSNTNPMDDGDGNLSQDPVFIDPASDFRLDPGSPCINAGTNLPWMVDALDVNGGARIIAETVDMGAYEAADPSEGPLVCNFDALESEGVGTLEAVFVADFVGANTVIVDYHWDFGDGNTRVGPALGVVTNIYHVPGAYTVTLTVTNEIIETASRIKTDYIYVAPLTAYVSTNGNHVHPYDSWEKAATNIQVAIDIARVIDATATQVVVTNGTYLIGQQIELLKGIAVSSVNGADVTVIRRDAGSQRIVWINHADAVLDGFTLDSGRVSGLRLQAGRVLNSTISNSSANRSGGGVVISGGVLSNSVVSGNWDVGNSGGCGGVVMTGGMMFDCLIVDNRGGSSGSEVGGLRLSGGQVWNTVIVSNRYGTGASGSSGGSTVSGSGTLYNSIVSANEGRGINQSGGLVVNTTVTRNSAQGFNITGGAATNLIVWYHGDNGTNITGALERVGHSASPDLTHDPAGTGNLTNAPLFIDPGAGYGTSASVGDLRLDHHSPCIDAGMNMPWMSGATDKDGNPRIVKGLYPPGPAYVDMGAYEYIPIPRGTIFKVQ